MQKIMWSKASLEEKIQALDSLCKEESNYEIISFFPITGSKKFSEGDTKITVGFIVSVKNNLATIYTAEGPKILDINNIIFFYPFGKVKEF